MKRFKPYIAGAVGVLIAAFIVAILLLFTLDWVGGSDGFTAIFTGILGIVAIGQVWLFAKQLSLMNKTMELTKDTTQIELRAYLTVVSQQSKGSGGMLIERSTPDRSIRGYEIVYKNAGKTPALNVKARIGLVSVAKDNDAPQELIGTGFDNKEALGSESTQSLSARGGVFPVDVDVYVVANIHYDDVFNVRHELNIVYLLGHASSATP